MPNCPEFVGWYYGVLRAGGVAVAASPHLTTTEIERVLDDAEPSVAVVDPGIVERFPRRTEICVIEGRTEPGTNHHGQHVTKLPSGAIRDDLSLAPHARGDVTNEEPSARVAVLQYTSGTTEVSRRRR